ncbi:MAG TPA: flagellar hook-associated protein FlgK [Thermodesulfobacteriota bacterium]|nr:flagellar hook-associated protein FlgK [Thermodesulfobacteriota bacterium]
MQGLTAVLNIAKGALSSNQFAMQVISHNLANVNTPGYTRQRANLVSEPPVGSGRLKLGMGVGVSSVSQAFDHYTTRAVQQNTSSLKEHEAEASILSQVESLFNDTGESGLAHTLDAFWGAWQDVANNPGGMAERTALLQKGQILAGQFNNLSAELNRIKENLNASVATGVQNVNKITSQIAELNEKIVAAEASGTTANDYRDQRNNLLEQLSGYVGTTILEQGNGSATVLTASGLLLVDGSQHWDLSVQGNSVYYNQIPSDISGKLTGGQIGGWLDMRDETLPQYLANLDELAGTIISQVNAAHVAGYPLAGARGKTFFRDFQVSPQVPNSANYAGAAAYMALSEDVQDHPENIAAGGLSGAPGDNENALRIAALQTNGTLPIRTWTMAGRGQSNSSSLLTGTMSEYYQDLVGGIGILAENSNENHSFVQSTLDRLGEIRDSISGVNLDEELTEMMKIQRSYEAASKMVTVADQMMQDILDMR